jgi:RNA polymerase sigma factor (sigma-70 family)
MEAEPPFTSQLADQAAAGDAAAMEALLRYLLPTLRQVIVGVLGSRHSEVDDVLQQVLLAVQKALPAFRHECRAAGYASRIALRIALSERRRFQLELSRRDLMARLSVDDTESAPASVEVEAERRRHMLRELMDELPVEQADVLCLRIMLGWSLEEIAHATGAPANTIRSRVRLAKEALRRRIEQIPALADLRVWR